MYQKNVQFQHGLTVLVWNTTTFLAVNSVPNLICNAMI